MVGVILDDYDERLNNVESCLKDTSDDHKYITHKIFFEQKHALAALSRVTDNNTEQIFKLREDINEHTLAIQKSLLTLTYMHLRGNPAQLPR